VKVLENASLNSLAWTWTNGKRNITADNPINFVGGYEPNNLNFPGFIRKNVSLPTLQLGML